MSKLPGLDDWIMGVNDPYAPFNREHPNINKLSEREQDEVLAEYYPHQTDIIDALGLTPGDLEEEFAQDYCNGRHWHLMLSEQDNIEESMRDCYREELIQHYVKTYL